MEISAKIIAASIGKENGVKIATMVVEQPRCLLAEFNTHRVFCLAGDARLDFELPSGQHDGNRRVYSMTLREFADKWHNGSAEGKVPAHNGIYLDDLDDAQFYTANEVAKKLQFANALNLNFACRSGLVGDAYKNGRHWTAVGSAWKQYRRTTGMRRFSIKKRLKEMKIRQIDERSGDVHLSTVVKCINSGTKKVYRIVAGEFSTIATSDHRFFTDGGWKRLSDLIKNKDKLCVYRYGDGSNEDPFRKIDGKWVSSWSKKVRDEVAVRQNGICSETKLPLEFSFHIHHVIPRHERPDLAFDINNVVAVNADAHRELHKKQGWQSGVPLGTTFVTIESIEEEGEQDTYDLEIAGEFANFFADGIVVHNSRNGKSSRAVPFKRMVEDLRKNYHSPLDWLKNQPGMVATEKMGILDAAECELIWEEAMEAVIGFAARLNDKNVSKQYVNRLLEPWMMTGTLVTSTRWANFFKLRDHKDAVPEFQLLAVLAKEAFAKAEFVERSVHDPIDGWHLPYIIGEERVSVPVEVTAGIYRDPSEIPCSLLKSGEKSMVRPHDIGLGTPGLRTLLMMCVARCCRLSYGNFDGEPTTVDQDRSTFLKLVSDPLHASPMEHAAFPLTHQMHAPAITGNFHGYRQLRKLMPNEAVEEVVL